MLSLIFGDIDVKNNLHHRFGKFSNQFFYL